MKLNQCCEMAWNKLCASCRALDRPYVKKRVDASIDIYGDKAASKPTVSLGIDGEWSYKLSCALKILAVIALMVWLHRRVCRWLRRIF